MTPTVDTEIADTLQWLRTTMESGTDFLTDQAPLYAEELLRYGLVSSCIMAAVGGLVVLVAILIFIHYWRLYFRAKEHKSSYEMMDYELGWVPILLISTCALLYGITQTSYSTISIVKINTAPRVYIMEHLKP